MLWWTLRQLRSKNFVSRLKAVEKLRKSNDSGNVELLLGALKDEVWEVRQAVAKAFRGIKDARAVRPLVEALNDWQPKVVKAAIMALSHNPDVQAVEPLIAALGHEDWGVRYRAADTLMHIGDLRAIEPLIAALTDDSGSVRESAVVALREIGDSRAIVPLLKGVRGPLWVAGTFSTGLKDNVGRVEEHRRKLLQRLGNESVVPVLIGALEDVSCAEAALKELQSIGWQAGTERERALIAFAKRDTKELLDLGSVSVDLLVKGFRQWDESERVSAARALNSLGWKPRDEAETIWFAFFTGYINDLPAISAEGFSILPAVLSSDPYGEWHEIGIALIEILGEKGDGPGVEILGRVITQENSYHYHEAAIEALRKIGGPSAVQILADQARKRSGRATEALIVIAPSWTVETLDTLDKDKDGAPMVIFSIENALRRSATDIDTSVLRKILSLRRVVGLAHYQPDPLFDNFDEPEWFPGPREVIVDLTNIFALAQSELKRRGPKIEKIRHSCLAEYCSGCQEDHCSCAPCRLSNPEK